MARNLVDDDTVFCKLTHHDQYVKETSENRRVIKESLLWLNTDQLPVARWAKLTIKKICRSRLVEAVKALRAMALALICGIVTL